MSLVSATSMLTPTKRRLYVVACVVMAIVLLAAACIVRTEYSRIIIEAADAYRSQHMLCHGPDIHTAASAAHLHPQHFLLGEHNLTPLRIFVDTRHSAAFRHRIDPHRHQ